MNEYSDSTATAAPRAQSEAFVIGRDDVEKAKRYAHRWSDLFNWRVPSAVDAEVRRRGMTIQLIRDSAGSLNLDRYEVRATSLPHGYTPESLLDHIRRNMNSFVNTRNTEFNPYSVADRLKWNSNSPVGAIFNLNIFGPDDAAVVGSMVEPRRFRFTTIEAPATGTHPVSGHREFGVEDDNGTTVIYTRGADRSTWGFGQSIVFFGANHLWESFQEGVASFINATGGSARIQPPFSERFHPDVVRILYGRRSSSQSFSLDDSDTDLPDLNLDSTVDLQPGEPTEAVPKAGPGGITMLEGKNVLFDEKVGLEPVRLVRKDRDE